MTDKIDWKKAHVDAEKKLEEDRVKAAVDMALVMFGSMMVKDARGDQKMIEDGKKYINDGFERIDKDFGTDRRTKK